MNLKEIKNINWPYNWKPVEDQAILRELRREISPLHFLFWKTVTVVARRLDQDDILVYIKNYQKPFATVHLTWSKREWTSKRPRTKYFDNISNWLKESIE